MAEPAPAFIHCWHANLTAGSAAWAPVVGTLSAAEQARLERLRTPALRQTYGRAHGFLRAVLGHYTGLPPSALAFGTEQRAKPKLLGAAAVRFNLSYRAGRALLAVSNCCAVGADVEPVQQLTDAGPLVQQLFSGPEQAALHATAPADWHRLFYTIWTRKEAYAKAQGMGLALPFAAFSVLNFDGQVLGWTAPASALVTSFRAGDGYQGAVAAVAAPATAPPLQHQYYAPGQPLSRP